MKNSRGFSYFSFKDRNGEDCSIQKSSIATEDCLWIGCDNNSMPHHATGQYSSPRMHINKNMAKKIIKKLIKFVETGDI